MQRAPSGALAKRVIMALSPSQAHIVGRRPARDATEALARRSRHDAGGGGLRAPALTRPRPQRPAIQARPWRLPARMGRFSPPDGGVGARVLIDALSEPRSESTPGSTRAPGVRNTALIDSCMNYLGPAAARPIHYVDCYCMHDRHNCACASPLDTGLLVRDGAALRPMIGRIERVGAASVTLWNGHTDDAVRAGHHVALHGSRSSLSRACGAENASPNSTRVVAMDCPLRINQTFAFRPKIVLKSAPGSRLRGKSRNLQRNDIIMSTLKVAFAVEQRDRGHAVNKGGRSRTRSLTSTIGSRYLGRPKERSKTP